MVASDPEAFNCETCPVRTLQAALDRDSQRALTIWAHIGRRFVLEHGLAGWTLQRLTRGWTDEEQTDLIERLALLYDMLVPPPKES